MPRVSGSSLRARGLRVLLNAHRQWWMVVWFDVNSEPAEWLLRCNPHATIDHCSVRLCGPMPSSPGIDRVSSVPYDTEQWSTMMLSDADEMVIASLRSVGDHDAAPHAQEPDDRVVAGDRELAAADADAAAGRGLARDREVGLRDAEIVRRQRDPAADVEHDRAVAAPTRSRAASPRRNRPASSRGRRRRRARPSRCGRSPPRPGTRPPVRARRPSRAAGSGAGAGAAARRARRARPRPSCRPPRRRARPRLRPRRRSPTRPAAPPPAAPPRPPAPVVPAVPLAPAAALPAPPVAPARL